MRERVLVAGSTGYLGRFMIKELKERGYWIKALCRNKEKIQLVGHYVDELFIAKATNPDTLNGLCRGIDCVFSSLGITKQKEGFTYMDVDYQANRNILDQALAERVSKFIYVSVLNADKIKHLQIVKAKERFCEELRGSDVEYLIIRPNGFFSDIGQVFKMAQRGTVYLLGSGEYPGNPIHGQDLAQACVDHLGLASGEVDIGGPEILSQNEIAAQAFEVLGKKEKILHFPLLAAKLFLKVIRSVTSVKTYGPLEFFLTVLTMDMIAPRYGTHTIRQYFTELRNGKAM